MYWPRYPYQVPHSPLKKRQVPEIRSGECSHRCRFKDRGLICSPWSQKLKCLDNLDNLENALTATVFEIEVSYAHQLCLGHHQTSPPNLRKIRKYFWLWSFSLQLSYTKKIPDLKVQFSKVSQNTPPNLVQLWEKILVCNFWAQKLF